jgi:hypothetical protein
VRLDAGSLLFHGIQLEAFTPRKHPQAGDRALLCFIYT